jgi:hypothetical protein
LHFPCDAWKIRTRIIENLPNFWEGFFYCVDKTENYISDYSGLEPRLRWIHLQEICSKGKINLFTSDMGRKRNNGSFLKWE